MYVLIASEFGAGQWKREGAVQVTTKGTASVPQFMQGQVSGYAAKAMCRSFSDKAVVTVFGTFGGKNWRADRIEA